ncbi:MAG: hypothetical protein A3G34_16630 [Candidatus Lindowbacteria bacterium RIFCSPLOWO2_12_FULL_62_27]|nr:MAG: hypothetical protein A3G34_16630 [Candidatus Lindowbacteria bacterium RIFCSPLOWO2_12_FULL_62_27]
MTGEFPAVLVLVVITNFYILNTGRYVNSVRSIALQGCLLAVLPLPEALAGSPQALFLSAGTLIVKGILMPLILIRVIRSTDEFRVAQPFLGPVASVLVGFAILAAAFRAGALIPAPLRPHDGLMGAVGLATILTGMLIMVNRRKAVGQVIGFLILENGILILSLRISRGLPFVIEMAVLFDVLLAAMIFGGFIQSVHETFAHTDVSRMRKLKG